MGKISDFLSNLMENNNRTDVTEVEERNEKTTERTTTTSKTYMEYWEMLGINKHYDFFLIQDKVENNTEFNSVTLTAKSLLMQDLKRLGVPFYEVDAGLRNKLMGEIGSMTIIGDEDGKLSKFFHKRNEDGLWDNISKKYPEKDTTGKYKYEIFFILEDDEED